MYLCEGEGRVEGVRGGLYSNRLVLASELYELFLSEKNAYICMSEYFFPEKV